MVESTVESTAVWKVGLKAVGLDALKVVAMVV